MSRTIPLWLSALVTAAALSGCAGTRTFRPSDAGFARRHIDGREATVTLAGGRTVAAVALRMTADSLDYVDLETQQPRTVPVADVVRLKVRDRRLTVAKSIGQGALLGAATGLALGVAGGAESGCIFFCSESPSGSDRLGAAALLGVFLGLSGGLNGAAAGAAGGAIAPARWTLIPEGPPASALAVPDSP